MRGRGKNPPHHKAEEEEEEATVSQICCDYCFMRDSPGGDAVATLCAKDRDTKVIFAIPCPGKGGGHEWAVEQLTKVIKKLSHGKCILKTDQEPALLNLVNEVINNRQTNAV